MKKARLVLLISLITFPTIAMSGPQAQAYVDMRNGMCKAGSMSGALPYVSERMVPYVNMMIEMESAMKGSQELSDTFAKQCYYGIKVLDQIPVNKQRYIIRYIDSDGATKEVPVTLERGRWKVDVPN